MFKNKTVVVTGGAGMIGSQLVELLVLAGANVVVADDFSRGQIRVPGADYIVPSDVSDYEFCKWLFNDRSTVGDKPVFAVFNLAAKVAGVLHNQKNHLDMFDSNVRLQTVPLMAAEQVGVKHFLQVSSACVYAEEHQAPCLEPNGLLAIPHKANLGYAMSKRMGEMMASVADIYHVVIVRPNNVYGPHDYFDDKAHVIPNFIKKCLSGDSDIKLHSPLGVMREFIYSRDVAKGMMAALERGRHREVYNLGCNGENVVSLGMLLDKLQKLIGTDKPVYTATKKVMAGDAVRYSDATKAKSHLNWQWETKLEDGLMAVLDWYGTGK